MIKKIFLFAGRCTRKNGANRYPYKEIRDIREIILYSASLYFGLSLPERRYYDEKNIFFAAF